MCLSSNHSFILDQEFLVDATVVKTFKLLLRLKVSNSIDEFYPLHIIGEALLSHHVLFPYPT